MPKIKPKINITSKFILTIADVLMRFTAMKTMLLFANTSILMKVKRWAGLLIGGICSSALLAIFITGQIVEAKPNPTQIQTILPEDVRWEDNLSLEGIQTATVIGNPGNAELYVLLSKMSEGAILPTHTHPDDRITTVLSGVMYYGAGEFNPETAKSYPAGSIVYTPAKTPHYMYAKDGETIMQQTGVGATEIDFLE